MKFHHPDQAVRRFWSLVERLGSLRAYDPFPTVGERCGKCGLGPAEGVFPAERVSRAARPFARRRVRRVCPKCQEPWQGVPVNEARSIRKDRRPSSGDEGLKIELATLGDALRSLPEWEQRVYVLLHLREGLSSRQIADECRPRWGRYPPEGTSHHTMNRIIRRGRERLEDELVRRGLMERREIA